MDADGSNPRGVAAEEPWEILPSWSPDGSTIAYRLRSGTGWAVALVDPSGGNKRVLNPGPGNGSPVVWTPDGKALVFVSANTDSKLVSVRVEGLLTQK